MAQKERERESGLPGGGAGRKDDVRGSGVYPMSGPHPPGDAPIVGQAGWGQGPRGPAGYEDHGESEIFMQQVTPERCRDIMTKNPLCCLAGDSTAKAAQLMREHEVGLLPVVSNLQDRNLLGVVTDRDLAMTVAVDGCDPTRVKVEEVMSRPAIVCYPDDPYQTVLRVMEEHQIRHVPAVDHRGRVVGIVSQADIALRVHNKEQTAEVVERVSRRAA